MGVHWWEQKLCTNLERENLLDHSSHVEPPAFPRNSRAHLPCVSFCPESRWLNTSSFWTQASINRDNLRIIIAHIESKLEIAGCNLVLTVRMSCSHRAFLPPHMRCKTKSNLAQKTQLCFVSLAHALMYIPSTSMKKDLQTVRSTCPVHRHLSREFSKLSIRATQLLNFSTCFVEDSFGSIGPQLVI